MKEIILLRHAKSDWGTEFLQDADRPLSERGYRDAYFMADWYRQNKPTPDLILTSTATRALNTALIFMRKMEPGIEKLALEQGIYEAPADKLLAVLRAAPSCERLMIVGHNPGLTDLANSLAESIFFDNVPTCGIVAFNAPVRKWKDLALKKASLSYYQFPKDFKNHD